MPHWPCHSRLLPEHHVTNGTIHTIYPMYMYHINYNLHHYGTTFTHQEVNYLRGETYSL